MLGFLQAQQLQRAQQATQSGSGHNPCRALLVDDDPQFSALLCEYLTTHAFSLSMAQDGRSGLIAMDNEKFDIIILDMMLPDMSGLEILQILRRQRSTPVVILSALNEETDRIVALELGADDYVSKSFSPRELLARLRAVIRRTANRTECSQTENQDVITIRGLHMENQTMEASLDGQSLNLTALEFRLLYCLARDPGRVFTRESLMNCISERNFNSFDRSIDMHISSLRRKLNDDSRYPQYFRTIRGVGYSFIK